MQAVILAGGLGTRLRPFTNTVPKPMVLVGGKPFLEHQIEALTQGGITDILMLIGYLGENIKAYFGDGGAHGAHISYSDEGRPVGIGGSLRLAYSNLEDTFLLLYGDVYVPINYRSFIDYFFEKEKRALVAVYESESDSRCRKRYNMHVAEDGAVTHYNANEREEKFNFREAGISILKKNVIDLIPHSRISGEEQFPLGDEVFNHLSQFGEVLAYPTSKRFCEIGTPEEVMDAETYLRELHAH